jgi:DNA polymerase elongation subunit (family B)
MDLKNMTDGEKLKKIKTLEKKISETKARYDYYKAMQLAYKLILNGTYGAFCHKAFVVSNKHIANAITAHGRDVILYMLSHIEDYFYNQWHLDKDLHNLLSYKFIGVDDAKTYYMINNKNEIVGKGYTEERAIEKQFKDGLQHLLHDWHIPFTKIEEFKEEKIIKGKKDIKIVYRHDFHDFSDVKPIDGTVKEEREMGAFFHESEMCVYGDTDSVVSNTKIITDLSESTIEELYNKNIINGSNGVTLKGHESVKTKEKVLNYSKEKGLYYAPIKRIIRHKVTKPKWQLKTKSGKSIEITNDHSLIVFRNNEQIEIKPKDVLNTDKILIIKRNI